MEKTITNIDRSLAGFCSKTCPGCKKARKKQKGFFFRFVKFTESGVVPTNYINTPLFGCTHERAMIPMTTWMYEPQF